MPKNINVNNAIPLMDLLKMNNPINACEQNAANAPVNNTSLPKYFLLFFSLFSLYIFNTLNPMSIVPSTNVIKPARPNIPKSNPRRCCR